MNKFTKKLIALGVGIITLFTAVTASAYIYNPTGSGGGGGVSSVTGVSPIFSTGGATPAISISLPNNQIGVGTGTNVGSSSDFTKSATAFDVLFSAVKALHLDTTSETTQFGYLTGAQASATNVGDHAGNGATGQFPTNVGIRAGLNGTGIRPTSVGVDAGNGNTGSYLSSLGWQAGDGNTGDENQCVGHTACFNKIGGHSLAIGGLALNGANGTNQIALGYNAGFTNAFSDTILLGDSSAATKASQFVVGSVAHPISNWSINGVEYAMPSADGSASDVLTTNGSGTLSWAPAGGGGGMAIGGAVTGGTDPAVLFIQGGLLAQDPTNFAYVPQTSFLVNTGDGVIYTTKNEMTVNSITSSLLEIASGTLVSDSISLSQNSSKFTDNATFSSESQLSAAQAIFNYVTGSTLSSNTLNDTSNISKYIQGGVTALNSLDNTNNISDITDGSTFDASNILNSTAAKLKFSDLANITTQVSAENNVAQMFYHDATSVFSTVYTGPSGFAASSDNSAGANTYNASVSGDSTQTSLHFHDITGGITSSNTLDATQNTNDFLNGTTDHSTVSLTPGLAYMRWEDLTGSGASSEMDLGTNVNLGYADPSQYGTFSVDAGSLRTIFHDNGSSVDSTTRQDNIQNTSEFTDSVNYDTFNSLTSSSNRSQFYDIVNNIQSQALLSPTEASFLLTDSAGANTFVTRINALDNGFNLQFDNVTTGNESIITGNDSGLDSIFTDVGGNVSTAVGLSSSSATLAFTNNTSTDITGFESQDLVATIGILNGGGNNTTLKVNDTTQQSIFNSGMRYRQANQSGTFNITTAMYYVDVDTSMVAATPTLPSAAAAGAGATYVITDFAGNALINNITITTAGGDSIRGSGTRVININYGSVTLHSNGVSSWIITQ